MIIEGKVGPQTNSDGAVVPPRLSRSGDQVVTDARGRYREAVSRGRVYHACNTGAQAVSAALTTTYTGLAVFNPAGSGHNLSILAAGYALSVAPAAIAPIFLGTSFIAAGQVTLTTQTAIYSSMVGGGASGGVARACSATTLAVAPVYSVPLIGGFTAAALFAAPASFTDIGGIIEVPPGGAAMILALTAVTGFGHISWEEIPLQ